MMIKRQRKLDSTWMGPTKHPHVNYSKCTWVSMSAMWTIRVSLFFGARLQLSVCQTSQLRISNCWEMATKERSRYRPTLSGYTFCRDSWRHHVNLKKILPTPCLPCPESMLDFKHFSVHLLSFLPSRYSCRLAARLFLLLRVSSWCGPNTHGQGYEDTFISRNNNLAQFLGGKDQMDWQFQPLDPKSSAMLDAKVLWRCSCC